MANEQEVVRLTGFAFEQVYRRAGYCRAEVGRYFKTRKTGHHQIGTARALYDLEHRDSVPPRYVRLLEELLGTKVFNQMVREVRKEYPSEFDGREDED